MWLRHYVRTNLLIEVKTIIDCRCQLIRDGLGFMNFSPMSQDTAILLSNNHQSKLTPEKDKCPIRLNHKQRNCYTSRAQMNELRRVNNHPPPKKNPKTKV